MYFVGDYANYYDPELARAFVAILKHNGLRVHVPPGQVGSGMSMISAGDLVPARRIAEHNVRELAEAARDGHAIVCTEPSAALCLSQEYPRLLDHPDVKLVASHVVEAGAFLMELHRAGELRTEFEPLDLDVGYHTPCHLRALSADSPLRELLSLIPQLRVHTIEEGCSGMAGAWGLTRRNFKTSIQMGWGLISRMRDGTVRYRGHRVQQLQNANGAGDVGADAASAQASRLGLRIDARDSRTAQPVDKKAGGDMKLAVRLFARAERAWRGPTSCHLDVPQCSNVGEVRRVLSESYPALAAIAPQLLIAVGSQYADDATVVDPAAEVACFPPVSGG